MSRFQVVGALALMLVLSTLLPMPPGTAQAASDGFVQVGVDPEGDATNDVVPGVDADAVVTSDRTDIVALDLKLDGDTLLVRMTILTLPSGSSGYLYDVFFDVGGETYFTCFTTQWFAGTTSQENIKGCSRFTEGTQVGPATTADGVLLEGEGPAFVTWPVPLADIGATAGDQLDNVVAETWFRGASDCCIGSTTDSQYMWNQADRAPDEDAWTATLGAGGALPLPTIVLDNVSAPSFVTAGEAFRVNATVQLDGEVDNATTFVLESFMLGATWSNQTEPAPIELDAATRSANASLLIDVPPEAVDTQAELTWRLCHALPEDADNDTVNETAATCAETTFSVSVFAPGDPDSDAPAPVADDAQTDADTNTTTNVTTDEESLPAPGFALAFATGLALLAVAVRRR